jgi:hypothetical protein
MERINMNCDGSCQQVLPVWLPPPGVNTRSTYNNEHDDEYQLDASEDILEFSEDLRALSKHKQNNADSVQGLRSWTSGASQEWYVPGQGTC